MTRSPRRVASPHTAKMFEEWFAMTVMSNNAQRIAFEQLQSPFVGSHNFNRGVKDLVQQGLKSPHVKKSLAQIV